MDKNEEKMKELLYDFRRYSDQLKEDGVEWVETAHLPPSGDTKVAPSRTPEPSRTYARPEKMFQPRKPFQFSRKEKPLR